MKKILIVGVGGLGCPSARILAGARAGALVLLDPDEVEESNLHRQNLYGPSDVGRLKAKAAAAALRREFPGIQVEPVLEAFPPADPEALIHRFDLVVDGLDRLEKKYGLNDACAAARVPFVHAGVTGFRGQVLPVRPGTTPCLRCLLPAPPPPSFLPTCESAGVFGPAALAVGALQGAAALELLAGRNPEGLWFDGWKGILRPLRGQRDAACPACSP